MPAPFSLHVLPPAFSLPSIDAECLATIAYLTWAVPRSRWTLVGESGFAENQQLPCLRDASAGKGHDAVVHGFDAIVRHLAQVSRGQWDLDAALGTMAQADGVAYVAAIACFTTVVANRGRFTSHLTLTLAPLVDLSLYICAENYDTTTRAAYGATLSFPESWMVPPERQKIAQARTSHLGFDASDLYNPDPRPSPTRGSRSSSNSPPQCALDAPGLPATGGYFRRDRGRSLANQAVTTARLTALIEEALSPLAILHASNPHRYLIADSPSTLDCHALAYLALALLPSLSNPFLATGTAKFGNLDTYTRATIREAFGPPVTASEALLRAPYLEETVEDDEGAIDLESYENANIGSGQVQLPWRRARRSAATVAMNFARTVIA